MCAKISKRQDVGGERGEGAAGSFVPDIPLRQRTGRPHLLAQQNPVKESSAAEPSPTAASPYTAPAAPPTDEA